MHLPVGSKRLRQSKSFFVTMKKTFPSWNFARQLVPFTDGRKATNSQNCLLVPFTDGRMASNPSNCLFVPFTDGREASHQMTPLEKRREETGFTGEAFKNEYNHLLETLASSGGVGGGMSGGGGGGGMASRNVGHRASHHGSHQTSNGIGSKGLFRELSMGSNHPLDSRGISSLSEWQVFHCCYYCQAERIFLSFLMSLG